MDLSLKLLVITIVNLSVYVYKTNILLVQRSGFKGILHLVFVSIKYIKSRKATLEYQRVFSFDI